MTFDGSDIFATPDMAEFYHELLKAVVRTGIDFRVGGTCAVNLHIGMSRGTKDLDIFCRAGDFPRLLQACAEAGFTTEIEDERWIAKVVRNGHYCDVIFGSANMVAPVNEHWFAEEHPGRVLDVNVKLLPPTELIWSKSFIKDRYKYDGNDVAHIILVKYDAIDWKRLLSYFEQHWEVLLMHVLNFRYIYPSERERLPRWVLDELLGRLKSQMEMPTPQKKVCRGRIFSRDDFLIDITEWGFADLVGDDHQPSP